MLRGGERNQPLESRTANCIPSCLLLQTEGLPTVQKLSEIKAGSRNKCGRGGGEEPLGLLGNEAIRRGVGEEDRVSQSPSRQQGHQKRGMGGWIVDDEKSWY